MASSAENNLNKTDHDQPGGIRGTEIGERQQGVTNHPQEESERQSKVVHEREQA